MSAEESMQLVIKAYWRDKLAISEKAKRKENCLKENGARGGVKLKRRKYSASAPMIFINAKVNNRIRWSNVGEVKKNTGIRKQWRYHVTNVSEMAAKIMQAGG